MKISILSLAILTSLTLNAQSGYWQQRIKYVMDIDLNVNTNIMKGKQSITYTNNSPDTLNKIFVHLFWNAFQPKSMMDVNSRSSESFIVGRDRNGNAANDYDRRFRRRIIDMKPDEQGYCNVVKLSYNGRQQKTKLHETILEVILDKPMLPKSSAVFATEFESQVPRLSRRSGRDNQENIRYSMGQWYPKISEYDDAGWHPDDYVRGNFKVCGKI